MSQSALLVSDQFAENIRHLFTRGIAAFIIVFGRRETGKTDLSLLIMETVQALGIISHFASNVPVKDPPFEIKYITNLDDLRLWTRETPGRKLFLFDELGKAMRRRTPMAALNIKLIDELQTLRKDKLSVIATTVDEKYVDQVSLGDDVLDGVFRKEEPFNQKIADYQDYLEGYFITIMIFLAQASSSIPRTEVSLRNTRSGTNPISRIGTLTCCGFTRRVRPLES